MFHRWILTELFFILEIVIIRPTEGNILPAADTFRSKLKVPSAATAAADGDLDEDDEYSLIVSRGSDILTSTQTQTGHYREITVTLTAFKETFVLDLKLNTYLFTSTYIEKAITNSGEIYNDVNHVTGHCYYTGEVRNKSLSTAAVSTCKGITGYFAIGNVSYHIEAKGDDLHGRHRVFRDHDDAKNHFRCGTDEQPRWMQSNNLTESFGRSIHRMKRSFLYPQDADKVDKVVEVYVANDRSQYLARASDVNSVYRRTKDIVNIASLAYQPLGIYIVLVGVEVWTDSDRFTIRDTSVSGALSGWYTYRQNSITPLHYNDNGILITNVGFYGGVIEKSVIGAMCSNQYSGSIISDVSSNAAATGQILAHGMGHSFGLVHDNDQCSCNDSFSYNRCIMYPSSSSSRPSTKWSSCSMTQFATSFSQGLDICLYNIPQTIFQPSSTCGNGIVEGGEQCDCGNAPNSECNSTCCNNATCQLTASAACAFGRCCDTSRCQIKSSGTVCRPNSNDCDLPEACNGVDALCPTDSYKPDGTDCTNIESAYCYQGQCRSHKSQCDLLWGPGTQVSDNLCYTRFNLAGAHYGNCGIRWSNTSVDYISCNVSDVMCGKLQCQDTSKALFYYQDYYLMSQASIGSYSCHSVIFDFGIGTQDPGLVPNGAKCGDRQMCVNQKCVNVPVPATPCGNGIVDDGEQCDCGKASNSECSSTCCNSATCQLTTSAACASGRCCDTSRCQIKSSGTECRSKSNDCDLSESCNGVDARCPTDSYKPDGTDCTNIESAYCYQGQCRSHRSQCELLWGPGTEVSDDLCYTRFNGAGAHYGNCGIRRTNTGVDYIACDVQDVMCGMLQCQDFSKALYYYPINYMLLESTASIGSNSCHSVIFDFGIGLQDPGLVPNGAKCGDSQMCVNHKCVNVTVPTTTTLSTTTCTSATASAITKESANATPQTSTSPSTESSVTSTTGNSSTSTKSTTTSTAEVSMTPTTSSATKFSRSRVTPRLTRTTSLVP